MKPYVSKTWVPNRRTRDGGSPYPWTPRWRYGKRAVPRLNRSQKWTSVEHYRMARDLAIAKGCKVQREFVQ